MLRNYIFTSSSKHWDLLLTPLEFAYNQSINRTTGFSPFQLTYGQSSLTSKSFLIPRQSTCPSVSHFVATTRRAIEKARTLIARTQTAQKRITGQRRHNDELEVGDFVCLLLIYGPSKFQDTLGNFGLSVSDLLKLLARPRRWSII